MAESLTTLFRPVGRAELDLVAASGFSRFPPRLPSQPIFYPVLTEAYAVEIARDWNTRDEASGFAGYVLRFRVETDFLARYPERIAGAARHRELWVPGSRRRTSCASGKRHTGTLTTEESNHGAR